ncbi:MAG TPA: Gldg family protein, partial [Myxococcaceae bacterium]|nr:Gldg family protein [Myxococcaceae bacterium]
MNKSGLRSSVFPAGLVAVVASLTPLVRGQGRVALWQVGVGVVVIVAGLLLGDRRDVDRAARGRSAFYATSTTGLVLAVLVALVAVNYIAAKRNKSWDITSKKVNSLAAQTTSALSGLKEKVTALGFVEPKNPMYGPTEALLQRYHSEAPDKFDYAFKEPLKSPDLVGKYQLRQGQDAIILTRGEGAAESHVTVPVPTEQELTNGLLKLSAVGQKKVYFLVGHGEWALEGARDA